LPRALASVPAGAVSLVIDAESADATVELARARGARIIVRPWDGFVATRRFALEQVRTEWTFMLDADEALDHALGTAILTAQPGDATDAYAIRRATFFCGRPMRHGAWGSDTPVRLFRTSRATLLASPAAGGEAEIHERWRVPGRVERLGGELLHYSYPTLASYREKFGRYTSLEARGLRATAVSFAGAAALAVLRAPWLLVVRGGWRDGWRGAFVALASAAYPAVVAWKAFRRA
jgi:glycosyltransferase involved in cell wall biosynthesis